MPPSSTPAPLASIEWQITRRTSADEDAEGELPADEGRALLAEAAALGVRRVLLAGGDPAARGDLGELIGAGAAGGTGMFVAAPPGSPALAAALPALASCGLRGVTASLHGADAKSHDAASGAPGSFAATIELLRTARELGLELEVRTALLPGRLRILPAMAQLVSAAGATRWTVVAPVGPGAAAGRAEALGAFGALALESALVPLATNPAVVSAPEGAALAARERGGFGAEPQGTKDSAVRAKRAAQAATEVRQDFWRAALGALALERALVALSDMAAMHRFEVAAIAAPHLARVVRMRHGGSPQGPAGRVKIERDGVERLFVSAAGEVFPSAELPIRLAAAGAPGTGGARGGVLAAALAHPVIEELRSGQLLGGKCGVCSFQRLCGGSRARAYAATSTLWAEDPSCAYVPKTT